MSDAWIKMIGLADQPCPEVYDKDYVEFRGARPSVRPGDHLVLYAVGGSQRVFALAEAAGPVYPSPPGGDGDDWPYRVDVRYAVNLPVSAGPHIDEVSTPGRRLSRSIRRRSHIRLSPEEYEQAASRLRNAARAQTTRADTTPNQSLQRTAGA